MKVTIKWAEKTTDMFPNLQIGEGDESDCFHLRLLPNQQESRANDVCDIQEAKQWNWISDVVPLLSRGAYEN